MTIIKLTREQLDHLLDQIPSDEYFVVQKPWSEEGFTSLAICFSEKSGFFIDRVVTAISALDDAFSLFRHRFHEPEEKTYN